MERQPVSSNEPSIARPVPPRGFPIAQHRSQGKSAFARAREEARRRASGPQEGPIQKPAFASESDGLTSKSDEDEESDWRDQMSRENNAKLDAMSPEELQQAREDILSKFGPGIAEVLSKARGKKESSRADEAMNTEPSSDATDDVVSPAMASGQKTPERGTNHSAPMCLLDAHSS